jgi:hypothetical protein
MRNAAQSQTAKRDIRTRQHLMERSFARATRYGFKRARWRRLWRVQIQEYLTSAIQNIMVLTSYGKEKGTANAATLAFKSSKKLFACLNPLSLRIRTGIDTFCSFYFALELRYQHVEV